MNRLTRCLGGGSSSKVVQDPEELPQPSDSSESSGQTDSSESIEEEGISSGVKFRWRELVDGTENFWITHLIGQGNCGDVYRCNFPRIDKVGAAKIHYHHPNHSGLADLLAEITTLREADHPNVIKLLGKHFGRHKSALVYEFMPNGSLDHHLFAHARQGQGLTQATRVLDWDTRMRIAVGVAEGLLYVHKGLFAIHRDVKVENILLDENFVPKLADFGFAAKIDYNDDGSESQREINTKGTEGYIAPETKEFGLATTKSDVYSYGVFLLVLFTGRKAYDVARPDEKHNLSDWLMPVLDRLEYAPLVIDIALGNKYSGEGSNRIFHTARLCIDAEPLERPDMDVVKTLVREAALYFVSEEPPVKQRHST